MSQDLPLYDLFNKLRRSGLPLGIDEYEFLLLSLRAGFGIADQKSLARLCKTLWVKSAEETEIFDEHFAEVMKQNLTKQTEIANQPISAPPEIQPPSETPKLPTPQTGQNESPSDTPRSTPTENIPSNSVAETTEMSQITVMEIEDEIQIHKYVISDSNSDEIAETRFRLNSDYLPVSKRQMKQNWRYLRRLGRYGPPIELDVEATVNKIAQQGILLEPVLVPRRINRAELVLLMDQDGSMVPFHSLGDRVIETAQRGGRLGKTGIYYFHNCPVDYLYHDRGHQEADTFKQVLSKLSPIRSSVLIFSDGGAARGCYNGDRLELTEVFLKQFKQRVRLMAWLNPVDKSRWEGTTAGEISRSIPMFQCDRAGLQNAIKVLRGNKQITA
ncbi:MAG: CoxE [Nostocales cyanobacterium W4_Combined_metabat2_030]|nr:CoxE [Nostocales cyanobacterium W4_Combined_metabat2_030]